MLCSFVVKLFSGENVSAVNVIVQRLEKFKFSLFAIIWKDEFWLHFRQGNGAVDIANVIRQIAFSTLRTPSKLSVPTEREGVNVVNASVSKRGLGTNANAARTLALAWSREQAPFATETVIVPAQIWGQL